MNTRALILQNLKLLTADGSHSNLSWYCATTMSTPVGANGIIGPLNQEQSNVNLYCAFRLRLPVFKFIKALVACKIVQTGRVPCEQRRLGPTATRTGCAAAAMMQGGVDLHDAWLDHQPDT